MSARTVPVNDVRSNILGVGDTEYVGRLSFQTLRFHSIACLAVNKSSVCRNKHNLFGLTNPRTKTYYEFNHWTESVKAYYDKVQYRYSGGNYLLWLDKIGHTEDKTYIRAIIRVLRQL